jgi:mannan polymerase II complex MNN10 subunit
LLRKKERLLFKVESTGEDEMAVLHWSESWKEEAAEFRYWWGSSVRLLRALLVLVGSLLLVCILCFYGPGLLLTRANELGRQCLDVRKSWPSQKNNNDPPHNKFALVTCSDGLTTIPQRSFEGMMELVTPNKKRYVERHGYHFIDASGTLDKDRPPSWSKILAVKTHLPAYDWVFWNDVVCSTSPSYYYYAMFVSFCIVGFANPLKLSLQGICLLRLKVEFCSLLVRAKSQCAIYEQSIYSFQESTWHCSVSISIEQREL